MRTQRPRQPRQRHPLTQEVTDRGVDRPTCGTDQVKQIDRDAHAVTATAAAAFAGKTWSRPVETVRCDTQLCVHSRRPTMSRTSADRPPTALGAKLYRIGQRGDPGWPGSRSSAFERGQMEWPVTHQITSQNTLCSDTECHRSASGSPASIAASRNAARSGPTSIGTNTAVSPGGPSRRLGRPRRRR